MYNVILVPFRCSLCHALSCTILAGSIFPFFFAASIFIAHQGQVRPLVPPTVVASPIKFPPSHLSTSAAAHGGSVASNNTLGTGGGGVAGSGESGSNKRERERESLTPLSGGPTPLKRIRVTRKSASGNGEE